MKTSFILNVFAAFILCGILIISCGKSPVPPEGAPEGAHPFDNDRALPYEYSDWMEKIDGSKYLSEITIPGTHDSGADLHTSGQGLWWDVTICQDFRLANQLKLGVRWFDIRLRLNDGDFTVFHSVYYLHKNVDDMIRPALDFLKSHPTEVVVFMIKQEHSNESDQTFASALYQHIQNNYGLDNFYMQNRVPTIDQARGKIVIVRRFGPAMDNFGMHFRWDEGTWGAHFSTEGVNIYVQDAYKSISHDDKVRIIKDGIGYSQGELDILKFHLNFTSYEGTPWVRLDYLASQINPVVNDFLLSNPSWHKAGVIMVNFAGGSDNGVVSSNLVKTIVNQNHFGPGAVTIGSQVWMRRNLNVIHYRNGDAIPQVTDSAQWAGLTTGAWSYYNNDPFNNQTYGKLYNWYAVNDPRGLCPEGWHMPSDAEWTTLTTYLGGESVAGGKMKAYYLWWSPNTGATYDFFFPGFSGLPGGYRDNGIFHGIGANGAWWSATENSTTSAWYRYLHYNSAGSGRNHFPKASGFSVRCVRD